MSIYLKSTNICFIYVLILISTSRYRRLKCNGKTFLNLCSNESDICHKILRRKCMKFLSSSWQCKIWTSRHQLDPFTSNYLHKVYTESVKDYLIIEINRKATGLIISYQLPLIFINQQLFHSYALPLKGPRHELSSTFSNYIIPF